MATTPITIEFIDGTDDIKVTINGKSFEGYDMEEQAIKAIAQAHFDEIFEVNVISQGDILREQAALEKFKKVLQNQIDASPELNLMIMRDIHEAKYDYYTNLRSSRLPHSQEMQLNILKEANIDPGKKATQSEITKALEKYKKEYKSASLQNNYGQLLMVLSVLSLTILIPTIAIMLVFPPVLFIIPAVVFSIGLGLAISSDIKLADWKETRDLFEPLQKLDPDFIAQLESEPLIRPEPQAEVEKVSAPELEPPPPYIVSGPQPEVDIKVSAAAPPELPPPYLDEDAPVKPETPRKKTF